ncbi:hypothetical protein F1D05_09135 [Kribbella qitaiheensis]|uniref:Uncharacterized protein n=1 Tax=Kribbella qitaiheensis TaxID=1544730 RepID=A0A7G6WVK4_9ACTN|nr:hypothetical protein [Kribbella qitaiheensis]QNE18019.1 hypothetical protein F1D05_09135 [Kribbella qitaiheensis]
MVNVLAELRPIAWSVRDAVAYEVALEGAGQVIGLYAELMAAEEAADEPDEDAIGRLRARQEIWAARRRELRPQHADEIAAIRSEAEDLLAEPAAEDALAGPAAEDAFAGPVGEDAFAGPVGEDAFAGPDAED